MALDSLQLRERVPDEGLPHSGREELGSVFEEPLPLRGNHPMVARLRPQQLDDRRVRGGGQGVGGIVQLGPGVRVGPFAVRAKEGVSEC